MNSHPVNITGAFGTHSKRMSNLRIIALGNIIRGPVGGMAWCDLHYLMGLASLGHEVYYVEDSDDYPSCYNPDTHDTDIDPTYGLQFATRTFGRVGLEERWAYYDGHTSRWLGPCADRILGICAKADVLLNMGGVNPLRPWLMEIPTRALIDKDPAFTQIRHLTDLSARNRALQHTAFFSFAENLGLKGCALPDDGLPWQATRHPVFLDAWPVMPPQGHGKFTTVMLWDSYPAREYGGVHYGMKSHSFGPYMDLPKQIGPVLELAVGSGSAPPDRLRRHGWRVRDPIEVTRDPWTYRNYIQKSKAEFGVAKQGYVVSRCGWFSERSASYLASGRPVLAQETGFSDWMETRAGVIPFTTPEEAFAGIEEISGRYKFHCQAAREIAEEYFDARKVLARLIECAMTPVASLATHSVGESK